VCGVSFLDILRLPIGNYSRGKAPQTRNTTHHTLEKMRKLDEQLKAAVLRMPVKEKDKLLLRLLLKDQKLIRRLIFELLEGGETREERAQELREQIVQKLPKTGDKYITPGLLLLELRFWNARITEHVQATKDKPGEVILTTFLLSEAFRRHIVMLRSFSDKRNDTFAPYVVRRTAMLLKKAALLHEDYFMEFRSDLNELLQAIHNFRPTALLAQQADLPLSMEY